MSTLRAVAVVLGAGSGTRMGAGRNKVLLELGGRPLLAHSLRTALSVPEIGRVVLVVRPGEEAQVIDLLAPHLADADEVQVVTGGATRHASETAALRMLRSAITAAEIDVVAVHDGARPLASRALWSEVLQAAAVHGGAVPVREVTGLIRRRDGARIEELAAVQTPQAFGAQDLLSAYEAAAADGFEGSDTAATVERYCPQVRIAAVRAPSANLKVTFPGDVQTAEQLLADADRPENQSDRNS